MTSELREDEDAEVDSCAHDARDERSRNFGPTFGDERDAVGPDATDAEADEEAQHQHLVQTLSEITEAAEQGVEQHAEAECAGATDFVAE